MPQDVPPPPPALYVDVTDVALPGVRTTCGGAEKRWILEVNGCGLALADFDGDLALDLLVVDASNVERARAGAPGFPPRLYLGDGEGGFRPAGEAWDVAAGRWGTGVAVADWNGDGWLDAVLTQWGPDRVLLNDEGAGWREVADCGLATSGWSTSAAPLDFDGDGRLDLWVCGYLEFDFERIAPSEAGEARWKGLPVMAGPQGLTPTRDRLYRGRGDGTFEDVSARVGLDAATAGYGLGVAVLDVDRDGDLDLYVANDSTPNQLWRDDGDVLREVGVELGLAYDANGREQAGMGIACREGELGPTVAVTNFSGEPNALYERSSRASARGARWLERSTRAGLASPSLLRLGWGVAFVDADLDGEPDLVVANGHVYPQADAPGTDTSYAQADQLFLARSGRFEERPLCAGPPRVSRALVAGDVDRDGDVDLVVGELDGAVRVLHGQAADAGAVRGTTVVLDGSGGPAIGARVELQCGGRTQRALVSTTAGFQSAVAPEVHFGLGRAERIELVRVVWPDGRESVLRDLPATPLLRVEGPR